MNKKAMFTVFILVATELIGFGLIIPILPQISQKFTSSGILLGFLLSSYSLAQFVAAPILGQLSDTYGRKKVLIASKFGTILSYILLAYSSAYWMILLSRLIDGFTGGNIAVARAYLSDITEKKDRSKSMAIIGIAFGTGFIIGPAIGGGCYALGDNFLIAGHVGAILSGVSLIITHLFLKEPEKLVQTHQLNLFKNIMQLNQNAIRLLSVYFFTMIIFSGFETSFTLYTEYKFDFNESNNSIMFLIIGIASFFIQGSFTKISIQPINKAIYVALTCIGLGLILTQIITPMVPSLMVLILMIFGIAIINSHLPAELSTISQQSGFVLGAYESAGSIARIIGPLLIFSTVFNKMNLIYLILGLSSFVVCFIFWLSKITKKSAS